MLAATSLAVFCAAVGAGAAGAVVGHCFCKPDRSS